MKIGILGLDTSHGPAFARLLREHYPEHSLVGAWPGGNVSIPASRDRVTGFTREIETMGIPVMDTPDAVARSADALLITHLDGSSHLPLYRDMVRRELPVFIDKPFANSSADAERIFSIAKEYASPVLSSSSVRFLPSFVDVLWAASRRSVRHVELTGPLNVLQGLPRYHFYAIHTVELLVALLGPDWTECQMDPEVDETFSFHWRTGGTAKICFSSPDRAPDFHGKIFFDDGYTSFADLEKLSPSPYHPLINAIVEFFETGISPVSNLETVGICSILDEMENQKNGK